MSKVLAYEEADSDYITEIFDDSNLSSQQRIKEQLLSPYLFISFKTIILISNLIIFTLVILSIVFMVYKKINSMKSKSYGKNFKKGEYIKINQNKIVKDIESQTNNRKKGVVFVEDEDDSELFKNSCELLLAIEQNVKSGTDKISGSSSLDIKLYETNNNPTIEIKKISDHQKESVILLEDEDDSERFESSCEILYAIEKNRRILSKPTESSLIDIKSRKTNNTSTKDIKILSSNGKKEGVILLEDSYISGYFESSGETLPNLEKIERKRSNKEPRNIFKDATNQMVIENCVESLSSNQNKLLKDDDIFEHFESTTEILSTPKKNEVNKYCSSRFLQKFSRLKNQPEIHSIPDNLPSSIMEVNKSSYSSHFTENLNISEDEKIKEVKRLRNPFDFDEVPTDKVPMFSYEYNSDTLDRYVLSPRDWLGVDYEHKKSDYNTVSEAFLSYGKKFVFQTIWNYNDNYFHSC